MSNAAATHRFALGHRLVNRLGYGAMQLAGPGVFGPPQDREAAIAVLREAVSQGINHIDTSDYYGPHITNQLIREALHPYPQDLVIVTKVGAKRGPAGAVYPAMSREELTQAVHDNLRNLGVDVLDVVNLRSMLRDDAPAEGAIEEPLTVIADLQRQGLIRHIGLSNVTAAQVAEGRKICDIVCVQNLYNLADRSDESLLEELARNGVAYVAYFPLGGITQLQSAKLSSVARRHADTDRARVVAAAITQSSANSRHVIACTFTRKPGGGGAGASAGGA